MLQEKIFTRHSDKLDVWELSVYYNVHSIRSQQHKYFSDTKYW